MPASAIRSMVESRNAPQVPVVPFIRASTPSSMSRNTKIVQVKAPGNSSPRGEQAQRRAGHAYSADHRDGVRRDRSAHEGPAHRSEQARHGGRSTFNMAVRSYCVGPGGDPPGNPDRPLGAGPRSPWRPEPSGYFPVTGEILYRGLVDTVLAG